MKITNSRALCKYCYELNALNGENTQLEVPHFGNVQDSNEAHNMKSSEEHEALFRNY